MLFAIGVKIFAFHNQVTSVRVMVAKMFKVAEPVSIKKFASTVDRKNTNL